jgi:hypothetical protein
MIRLILEALIERSFSDVKGKRSSDRKLAELEEEMAFLVVS